MRNFILASLALATAAAWLPSAMAAQITATCNISTLVDGDKTTCDSRRRYKFDSNGPGNMYALKLKAPASHCSDVQYIVLNNDTLREITRTRWLSAGQEDIVGIGDTYSAGSHFIFIKALGRVGGCNEGRMQSWGAEVNAVGWN